VNSWGRSTGFLVSLPLVLLPLVLLAACSSDTGDTSGAFDSGWTTPATEAPSLANRPSKVNVDHTSSCDLLTEAQRSQLKLTGEQTSELSTTWSTNTCRIWDGDHAASASVTAVSTSDLAEFYHGRFANMQVKPIEVRGFPALFYRFDGAGSACYLAVGVAERQLVDVAFGGKDLKQSQSQLCETTQHIAEAAMDTVLAAQ